MNFNFIIFRIYICIVVSNVFFFIYSIRIGVDIFIDIGVVVVFF